MNTRTCNVCNTEKLLSEFHQRKNKKGDLTYCYVCKPCACQRARESYQRNKESAKARCAKAAKARILERRKYVYEYLRTHPCVECEESDPVVLEFDHIDREDKDTNICQAIWANWAMKRLNAEIAKCQVLCANCHRRRTAQQLGWYAFIAA